MKRWCTACWSWRVAVRYAHVASGAAPRPHLEYPVFRVGEPCECAQIAARWQQRTCGYSSALPTELAPQTALAAIGSPGAEAMTSKDAQCERAGAAFRDPMAARVRAGESNLLPTSVSVRHRPRVPVMGGPGAQMMALQGAPRASALAAVRLLEA